MYGQYSRGIWCTALIQLNDFIVVAFKHQVSLPQDSLKMFYKLLEPAPPLITNYLGDLKHNSYLSFPTPKIRESLLLQEHTVRASNSKSKFWGSSLTANN